MRSWEVSGGQWRSELHPKCGSERQLLLEAFSGGIHKSQCDGGHLKAAGGVEHRSLVNNTEDNRQTAADTGSRFNDCCPYCTPGNNQHSFAMIAGFP
ncbi:hypothetical protein EYF80_017851 [Liparis tanakae]|uniref:Uncharacterized protein n=1 Tax=Liparis tanakae TaxID=230148 RepID=A0A4Z2I3F5_9TELE|nr:hypothetical protein EYF80_017851 [Liparis tanakae]